MAVYWIVCPKCGNGWRKEAVWEEGQEPEIGSHWVECRTCGVDMVVEADAEGE